MNMICGHDINTAVTCHRHWLSACRLTSELPFVDKHFSGYLRGMLGYMASDSDVLMSRSDFSLSCHCHSPACPCHYQTADLSVTALSGEGQPHRLQIVCGIGKSSLFPPTQVSSRQNNNTTTHRHLQTFHTLTGSTVTLLRMPLRHCY